MVRQRPFGSAVPWGPRLLLLAALLLGIVTMHTLGHPTGGHGGHSGHGAYEGHGPQVTAQAQRTVEHHEAAVAPSHGSAAADPSSADGMDPMTVCLAVLAGWTLVLLVAGPLLRRSGDAAAEVRARLLRAVRALPPPGGGRMLLTRLSVLRQ
ncbi:DUF6153 family protein [Kitasatospora sp. SUK 42]|uniref:DUF6153 family protein n=1 Tax=Kitasatospora sp. SUK 42 TaxID=1588882 RepID=UPI0018CA8873|nr:DUF6153 family protein [Kitasatospora sp. SUK 42]MBV2156749.1 hypothetical protein [Kitasatospora sp. SUK 42]